MYKVTIKKAKTMGKNFKGGVRELNTLSSNLLPVFKIIFLILDITNFANKDLSESEIIKTNNENNISIKSIPKTPLSNTVLIELKKLFP